MKNPLFDFVSNGKGKKLRPMVTAVLNDGCEYQIFTYPFKGSKKMVINFYGTNLKIYAKPLSTLKLKQ